MSLLNESQFCFLGIQPVLNVITRYSNKKEKLDHGSLSFRKEKQYTKTHFNYSLQGGMKWYRNGVQFY